MFTNNVYATVWSVEPSQSGNFTKVRLSTSSKNADGNYEQDFGDFCMFVGKANEPARKLKVKDKIKISRCGVKNRYVKDKNVTYYDFVVFEFEMADGSGSVNTPAKKGGFKKSALDDEIGFQMDDSPF